MKKIKTRLAYLMNRLNVTPKKMADDLAIHSSQISRWRSGQRVLTPTNSHAVRIAAYLISKDLTAPIIPNILDMNGLDDSTGTQLENLTSWLVDNSIADADVGKIMSQADSYKSYFKIYIGYQGLRQAVTTLFNYVLMLPPNQVITSVVRNNYYWLVDDPTYAANLFEQLDKLFERGTTLRVIFNDNFDPLTIAPVAGPWLVTHLKGYAESYQQTSLCDAAPEKISSVVENAVALRFIEDAEVADNLYIAMYTDAITVRQVYNYSNVISKTATKYASYNFFARPKGFLASATGLFQINEPSHLLQRVPGIGTIPRELMRSTAKSSLAETQILFDNFDVLLKTPEDYQEDVTINHVFSLEEIIFILDGGRKVDTVLSTMLNRKIYHSKQSLLEQLIAIRFWLIKLPNYDVAFAPAELFDTIEMEYIATRNAQTVAWLPATGQSVCLKKGSMSSSVYFYAEIVWQEIPLHYKNKPQTIKLIEQLIKKYR